MEAYKSMNGIKKVNRELMHYTIIHRVGGTQWNYQVAKFRGKKILHITQIVIFAVTGCCEIQNCKWVWKGIREINRERSLPGTKYKAASGLRHC